ncbi:MAG: Na/Pi cotransporter family protein [Alphaproteobacteria bacterium]
MSTTHVLASLAGAIALLLWGIHMVHTGVLRAFGGDLRRFLGTALKSRWRALLAGVGVTAVLQSSTATAMMATSFAAEGVVDLVPAMAVMLGANVGTTLITQVLSFDVTIVFPLLIAVGVAAFRLGRRSRTRDLGRVAIGLGLMLLALHLLVATIEPIEAAPELRAVLAALGRDPLMAAAVAAAFTWAAHSSVATMLFVMSLAAARLVPPEAALAMVVGANLGSAVNPLLAAGRGDRSRRRLPAVNLANRLVGCALALPLLGPAATLLARFDDAPARLAANFHTVFNLLLAAAFILPLPWIARAAERLLPAGPAGDDPGKARHLDAGHVHMPPVALANAAREVLRLADVVETMLRGSREVFRTGDRRRVAEIRRMDDVLDRLHAAVHCYLAQVGGGELGEDEARRSTEILSFAVNLEHIGDIVDKSLMELAAKRIRHHVALPAEALAELDEMHDRLLAHLALAVTVVMTGDTAAARRLVAEKDRFRELERRFTRRVFGRVNRGEAESVETAGLRLDVIRDLKRIEAHVAAAAYPLLEAAGELRPTRLAV